MPELPKQYEPASAQERWYAHWIENGYFHADPTSGKKPYAIVIPPPNVTGALHLGHALNNTLQDILIRWRRMQGFDALWMPGTDHAGIATQAVVERRIFEEEKKTRRDLGRDALVKRIWEWKDQYEKRILEQLRLMGCSCDWERTRFTLDEGCSRAVRMTFFNLFKKKLIYRGKRLVNWDTHLRTAVADDEIYYEETRGELWSIAYPVIGSESGERLIVATTRPETLLGDTAVAVHPKDPRYAHLIGSNVRLPLLGREIPVIGDPILVDPAFGTGCVKVTPAHDPNDYQTGLRHNLPMINLLNPDGTLNENAGPYAGLGLKQARTRVVEDLKEQGLLVKTEPYAVRLNFSDRSKTPIEPYLSDQWFVAMDELAETAMDAVRSGRVRIHPERYAKSYLDWLGEKRDWCISRQLWWGHRIPIWHCVGATEADLERAFAGRSDVCWSDAEGDERRRLVCALEDLKGDELGAGVTLEQDPDVLDTWFSSALWPHSTLGWPDQTIDLETYYPTSVLSTARDIITLWVARMVIFGLFNLGEVPFRDVFIHPVIQDGKGKRMSKSAGNGIDPVDIIRLYGADALRFTLAGATTETQDLRMPVEKAKLADGTTVNTSERFELGRTFPNKFWNAARFALMNLADFDPGDGTPPANLNPEDSWILARLDASARTATELLEEFRFAELTKLLRDLTWNDFCDWYLEFAKVRLKTADAETALWTKRVLAHALDQLCRLLHPIVPFVTEQVWQALNEIAPIRGLPEPERALESACIARWPEGDDRISEDRSGGAVERLQEVIAAIRNLRAEARAPEQALVEPVIVCADEQAAAGWEGAREMIIGLTRSKTVRFVPREAFTRPAESASRVLTEIEVVLPLEGLIDREAERARLTKEASDLGRQIDAISTKLANEAFVSRAPADVVEGQKAKLAELTAKRNAVLALIEPP